MVIFNGRLPKFGFFLAQLCLDTQIKGKIGRKVSFNSSSNAIKKRWRWLMVLFNGRIPKIGFFLAQLCLDTQVTGKIGKNVAFASSSIARNTMVEMLYGDPQWKIPQDWFLSCLIVSTYSTIMIKLMFPLLATQLQEKQWWRFSMLLLAQLMDYFLLN